MSRGRLNRRQALTLGGAGMVGLGTATQAMGRDLPELTVHSLKTQQLADPIGIESHAVRLSWQLASRQRNVVQQAYRICVASSPELLRAGKPDLWDSGRRISRASFDIAYSGKQLASRQRAFWMVQVWDGNKRLATSEIAFWEMGLLSPAEWRGGWLACETDAQRRDRDAGLTWVEGNSPAAAEPTFFRAGFELSGSAHLHIFVGASRACTFFLDGQAVPLPPRSPLAWGPPPVAKVELTAAAGRHVIGVSFGREQHPDNPACAVTVRATFDDGSTRYFDFGQVRCARREQAGWAEAGFDASGWSPACRAQHQPQRWPGNGAFLLRQEFDVAKEVVSARIYATALGAYELRLNGRKIGDALLAPECTDTRKRVYYEVEDVTRLLRRGSNALGAWVGDGWHGSYTSPVGRYAYGGPPLRFLAQLELTYADGRREIIATGPTWQMAHAPITMCEIYDGEDYDARLEQPGWDLPGFAGKGWSAATVGETPRITLSVRESPPIRITETRTARSVTEVRPGVFVFDFGQNFAGLPRLRAKGTAGSKIEMRFAERLKADGNIDQANLRAARAADTYILRGDPNGETYVPRFTYHGFRWVELTGYPGRPAPDDLQALVIHSDLDETGRLDVDNALIEGLWHNTLWSQRSNFMGLPTDCPQRDERLGWMGDANVFWDAASFNMNVAPFTRRFMRDVRDAQMSNGAFSDYSPAGGERDEDDAQSAPGWADAGVILPWTSYRRLGDTAVIDENWDAMARYIAMIERSNPDLVWRRARGSDYADWLALDAVWAGDPTTPKDLIGTATFKHSTNAMAEMARATGRTDEAARYSALSASIRDAFIAAFVRSDGAIGNGSQTGYILALNYGLVPPNLRKAAFVKLVADIHRRGTLLSTGFLGTPGSLDCLYEGGEYRLIYDLLLRTAYPSWGYMVTHGATTIWERWNGDMGDITMNSFNHYALGAVNGFVFRKIAGLTPLEPGFRRFVFDPVYDERVPGCSVAYDSVLGRIAIRWKKQQNRFSLNLEVPPNAEAVIHLPARRSDRISESGATLRASADIREPTWTPTGLRILVGSGHYQFAVAS